MLPEFLTDPGQLPFTVALALLALFGLLEMLSVLVGHALSHVADSWLPDLHLDHGALGPLEKLLAWLHVGRVPVAVLFTVFLAVFGLSGLLFQEGARALLGHALAWWIAVPAALAPTLAAVHGVGKWGARAFAGRRETDAVSAETLVGRRAVITLGEARRGFPAQAKVRDEWGRSHYVMIEPSADEEAFEQGREVTLVERRGGVFTAV